MPRMTTSYLVASVAGQRVAFEAAAIDAIVKIDESYPIPGAPAHVEGLCAVRSSVMTVIDLANIVGHGLKTEPPHAVVLLHSGHRFALRVDQVADVEAIDTVPVRCDPSIGGVWHALAPTHIQTSFGAALLLNVGIAVSGEASRH
jgi:purine-binding chemotaxis protein CheW